MADFRCKMLKIFSKPAIQRIRSKIDAFCVVVVVFFFSSPPKIIYRVFYVVKTQQNSSTEMIVYITFTDLFSLLNSYERRLCGDVGATTTAVIMV